MAEDTPRVLRLTEVALWHTQQHAPAAFRNSCVRANKEVLHGDNGHGQSTQARIGEVRPPSRGQMVPPWLLTTMAPMSNKRRMGVPFTNACLYITPWKFFTTARKRALFRKQTHMPMRLHTVTWLPAVGSFASLDAAMPRWREYQAASRSFFTLLVLDVAAVRMVRAIVVPGATTCTTRTWAAKSPPTGTAWSPKAAAGKSGAWWPSWF